MQTNGRLCGRWCRLARTRRASSPDGTSIDFITTEKSGSVDLYERLARFCDEQISKAVLGQTLTSDSGGGSYAQSKTHNEVRHDLIVADCKALAATLRRDLIRPLCLFNFGESQRIPKIRFDCEESEDLLQIANILGALVERPGCACLSATFIRSSASRSPRTAKKSPRPVQTQDWARRHFKETPAAPLIPLKKRARSAAWHAGTHRQACSRRNPPGRWQLPRHVCAGSQIT